MRKILIFGNSGSGKSTLAKKICESEDLPHLDLDTLAWLPTTPPSRQPLKDSCAKILDFTASDNGWVIEGCYADLIEAALPYASEVIFINLPVKDCIRNARNRPWEPHKYDSKEKQDQNLDMLINWIAQYPNRTDTFSLSAHEDLYARFPRSKIILSKNT